MSNCRINIKKLKSEMGMRDRIEPFKNPKIELEQYATTTEIASELASYAQLHYGDIEDKLVADLGCGCGNLSIAAGLMGCGSCVGFDIDEDALEICASNLENFDLDDNIDLVQTDIFKSNIVNSHWYKQFDTVITNPPFGTKGNAGADMKFLECALALSKKAVYSFHKTSTQKFIKKKAEEWGVQCTDTIGIKFFLPKTYKFHKKKEGMDIEVMLFRFEHIEKKEK